MVKIRILCPIDHEQREALMRLLEEAGCEVVDDLPTDASVDDDEEAPSGEVNEETAQEEVKPNDVNPESSADCDEDMGIVVLSPECLEDGSLDNAMQQAAARGCHVVGVWPQGAEAQELPRAFEDYGGDTVIWDPNRLRDVVTRPDAKPTWPSPADQPRAERPLKRNKC